MRIVTIGLCAALGFGFFAVGCDESSSTTPKVDTTAADKAADKAADSAKSTADKMNAAAADAKNNAGAAMDTAKDKAAGAVDTAKDAAGDMMAQVQKLYDDAKASLTKMPPDVDTAQKYVDQLKGWQDKLPADWKAKIDELVKMLGDAKDKLKNMPGMPK